MADSSGRASAAPKLAVERLEDRTVPTFLARPGPQQLTVNSLNVPTGGLSIAAGDLLPDPVTPFGRAQNEYVTGTGPGVEALVRVWRLNGLTNGQGVPALAFNPFPGFTGGVNVAVGDVTGDGAPEIIVAVAGNGPPIVKVYNAQGQMLSTFLAFDPTFMGGVNIAVGNVLGGIAAGGFSGGAVSSRFKQEIIVGAAAGTAPHVVVTDAAGTVLRSFLAFDVGYRGGVTVAAASIDTQRSARFNVTGADTNAYDEIVVGAATNVPHVKAFEVFSGAITERLSFFAFDPAISQGVTVAAGSTDGRRGAEIYVSQSIPASAAATAQPLVRAFDATGQVITQFAPYPPGYSRVVNMVVGYFTPPSFINLGFFDPRDDDSSLLNTNRDFLTQDLALVAGDGPFQQQPRFFIGLTNAAAGLNGP